MLRDFQAALENEVFNAWQQPNIFNVMPVMATGGGKTVLVSSIVQKFGVPTAAIAHRQELVSQMALAFNRDRIPHGIIAPKDVIRSIIAIEHETHGYSLYNHKADTRVAGIDTLLNHDKMDRWLLAVGLAVIDEGHHVLRLNKWGAGMLMLPNARGLFPTAHAVRADGKGLGREADGLVDQLCIGPHARELINRGYLTDYEILCPESDLDFSDLEIGPTGDFSMPKLRAATHKSKQLVGDVVKEYLKHAPGKLGLTFAVDILGAKEICAGFRRAGVPADIITAHTPIKDRARLMKQFRARQLLQLVSVDTLGEGTDVPAVQVISMARRTASWQLFGQQFGRDLRILVTDQQNREWGSYTDQQRLAGIAASEKPKALIIDHVGNTIFHSEERGLPCSKQEYTTGRRPRRARGTSDAIPLRPCPACTKPYERYKTKCPYCKFEPLPAGRGTPEEVEGDLFLLDLKALEAMRADVKRSDGPPALPVGASGEIIGAIRKRHYERMQTQSALRESMEFYGGWRRSLGEDHREAQKRFYLTFGVDILTAQTLNATDGDALREKIEANMMKNSITRAA